MAFLKRWNSHSEEVHINLEETEQLKSNATLQTAERDEEDHDEKKKPEIVEECANPLLQIANEHKSIGKYMTYDETPSIVRSMWAWHGTVFEDVVRDPDIWIFIVAYIIFTLLNIYLFPGGVTWPVIEMGPMATLTVFFLVFFNGHCYTRYWAQYTNNMSILKGLREFDITLFGMVDIKDKAAAKQASRYLQAAHLLAYMHLFTQYRNGEVCTLSYEILTKGGILTEDEVVYLGRQKHVSQHTTQPSFICLQWCMKCVAKMERSGQIIGGPTSAFLRGKVASVSAGISTLAEYQACYIPYFYFHILNVCLIMYLTSSTYSASVKAINDNNFIAHGILHIFVTVGCAALRKISTLMIFAYGEDSSDLPGTEFINTALREHYLLVEDHFDPLTQKKCPPGTKP